MLILTGDLCYYADGTYQSGNSLTILQNKNCSIIYLSHMIIILCFWCVTTVPTLLLDWIVLHHIAVWCGGLMCTCVTSIKYLGHVFQFWCSGPVLTDIVILRE